MVITFEGKNVGKVEGVRGVGTCYIKRVRAQHYMQKPERSLAVGREPLNIAIAHDATDVRVIDDDNGAIYQVSIERLIDQGAPVFYGREFGAQLVLPLRLWTVVQEPRTEKQGGLPNV